MADYRRNTDLSTVADIAAIIVGIISIVANFIATGPLSNAFCLIAAFACVAYIVYAIYLWIKRADFDWHLIKGNFLRKVCCLVVLMPSLLSSAGCLFIIDSPKELSYADELLELGDKNIPFELKLRQESPNIFWSTYFHFIDAGNQHMTTTKSGRLWAAVIAMFGVFLLNGLLVSSIIGWIDKRKEDWRTGTIRYKTRHLGKYRYAIVIGANEIASSVIKNLFTSRVEGEINYKCEGDNRYVVLHTSRNPIEVRAELASHLTPLEMKRVIIYNGLRDSAKEMESLHPEYATEIYILGESSLTDGSETYHDAMNMRCVNIITDVLDQTKDKRELMRKHNGHSVRKVCKVMFEYDTTSSIFQFSDISDKIKDNMVFIPFNRYESWARKVIVDGVYNDIEYMPLEGTGIAADSLEFVHLVIVGMSKMGIAIGVEALLQAHYMNSDKARTRITFIDTNADQEKDFFKGRYPNMFELIRTRYIDATAEEDCTKDWCDPLSEKDSRWSHLNSKPESFLDVEVEFIKGAIESEGVRKCLRQISDDKKAKLTIAICLTYTHQAIAASLYMPIEVYKNERLQQILVYQRESEDILSNLNSDKSDLRYEKIRPFGMLYGEYMNDRSLYLKAMLSNAAYCIANGYIIEGWPEDIANKNDKGYVAVRREWNELSVAKMWSNRYYADSIYIKIRNLLPGNRVFCSQHSIEKYCLWRNGRKRMLDLIDEVLKNNENQLAVCEHNRWNIQQLLAGYSPADKELDAIFKSINSKEEDMNSIMDRYMAWKMDNLNSSVLPKSKIKEDVKECPLRIHPNICSFEHLSDVDSEAKRNDSELNNAIPKIISIVEGHKTMC